ncbi:3'(2'),5'-bisphosphate nucleotidase CysQ [Campylobacter sp. RM9344]|uniref:3'(2'),5'-bisphosphate nucleotidase CysQ n=1 Tax=Campylobacter californiensis TaxID=1032243 RepID=A0AAW3ZS60_9BACT|nr:MULTISPECIES: 3'(2'),5'-bisphosphate nucleotidase CysQ [unclassified Campylobacter]MBE2984080.1 3'(2'),5'-bisphosphate nucleotidase CysQ [Campylobacter sp. RM6883]MBE2995505.1 3'(2'),5'-bisphosphate nucleotidase CysQ [Campylobacter sp. RM6913]MBE3029849.1 3'(2'),5'-bisphosphate nucleotidase CysQ [Campylobacter sp. RM9344]MBE3607865.1 3'(2'),5'-bisphosphate nucleotidase CysQ [Campylobacter sp. RM9337]QCD51472.1 adenosine-3'(2'),5'-bisphosphate nucleotidase [Campylobacter sp. RM6914]
MLENLITLAKKAALAGGAEILKHYDDFSVSIKSDNSPVTSADLASNEIICKILGESDLPICSEENELKDTDLKKFWLIDPLDGTKEFIDKNGNFCVCIALIENLRPSIGVIYIPTSDELFYASRLGAFKQTKNGVVNLNKERQNGGDLVLFNTRNQNKALTTVISKLNLKSKDVGSAIKFCRLAEGSAGVYMRFSPCSIWDIAAGDALIEFSGGVMCQAYDGKDIKYNLNSLSSPHFIALSKEKAPILQKTLSIIENEKK